MISTISLPGIRDPNISILIENILKSREDNREEIRFIISPSNGENLAQVAKKYGYAMETGPAGNNKEIRFLPSGAAMPSLDVSAEVCPGPVILVGTTLSTMTAGERLKVIAANPDSAKDIAAALSSSGSKIIREEQEGGKSILIVEKGEKQKEISGDLQEKSKVLIVQSNGTANAERAYATFLFAKVAISMGKEVTIFFLMDGVSLTKRGNAAGVKHPAFARLDTLMHEVVTAGAAMYACELSASFRKISGEDLEEGVNLAGAATYLKMLADPGYAVVNF